MKDAGTTEGDESQLKDCCLAQSHGSFERLTVIMKLFTTHNLTRPDDVRDNWWGNEGSNLSS